MAASFKVLTADQVKAGDPIPPLSVKVSATTVVLGALASRDWRPMHHDKDFAMHQGVKDIFLNTPNQAAWFERYITDWAGPLARLGRMNFKMKKSVCPGDTMEFTGSVSKVEADTAGCCWAEIALKLTANGDTATDCTARLALPAHASDNPWSRRGERWKP
jgi:acyl dehydratase